MTTPREAVAVCVRSPHQSRQRGPVRSAVDLPDTEIKRGRQHGLRSQGPESCPYTQELVATRAARGTRHVDRVQIPQDHLYQTMLSVQLSREEAHRT